MATDTLSAPARLRERAALIEAHLERIVPAESTDPSPIHAAMRHSLFAGGKRLRPALVLESALAAGLDDPAPALPAAAALEMIHTYSLIHDDLPCMDDDALRRGRPTCHVVHGEAMAVLAGDALLTLAFAHLGRAAEGDAFPAEALPKLVRVLGEASGTPSGMVAGQVADLGAEGKAVDAQTLDGIHRRKTGALITAACQMGAIVARADAATEDALVRHGEALGLAFQILDDILDTTQTSEALGKTAGKDADQGKATYVAVHGLDASRAEAARQTDLALSALEPLGPRGEALRALAAWLLSRDR